MDLCIDRSSGSADRTPTQTHFVFDLAELNIPNVKDVELKRTVRQISCTDSIAQDIVSHTWPNKCFTIKFIIVSQSFRTDRAYLTEGSVELGGS
eukprot:6179044-Pleurochrysis_carterae.AAC.2